MIKSHDQSINGYWAHDSPTFGSVDQMVSFFDLQTYSAGENIYLGNANAFDAVQAWIKSDGHYKNLITSYHTMGAGAIWSPEMSYKFTHNFGQSYVLKAKF